MKIASLCGQRYLLAAAMLIGCGQTKAKNPTAGTDAGSTEARDGPTQPEVGSAQSETSTQVDVVSSRADTGSLQADTQAGAFVCTTAAPWPGSGRVMFDLQGSSINPSWGHLFDGEMVFPSMVNTGGILVVGRSNQNLVYLFAATDPRPYHCAGAPQPDTGDCSGVKDSGSFNVDFPGKFVGSQGFSTLTTTNFEFYTMSTSVPVTTPLTEEKLPILMADATKIANVPGADIAPYLCSNN